MQLGQIEGIFEIQRVFNIQHGKNARWHMLHDLLCIAYSCSLEGQTLSPSYNHVEGNQTQRAKGSRLDGKLAPREMNVLLLLLQGYSRLLMLC